MAKIIIRKRDGQIALMGSRTYGEVELVNIANHPRLSKAEKMERLDKKGYYVLPEFLRELKRHTH